MVRCLIDLNSNAKAAPATVISELFCKLFLYSTAPLSMILSINLKHPLGKANKIMMT